MNSYKQVIVLKDDLGISRGKMISQACHASLNSYKQASEENIEAWESEGAKKVVLKANDLEALRNEAQRAGLPHYLVKDAGLTEVEPGTVTALGLGPAKQAEIDSITGELELIA